MSKITLKIIISEQQITIKKGKNKPLSISRSILPETYKKVKQLYLAQKINEISGMYGSIKKKIESYSKEKFSIDETNTQIIDKETGEPLPKLISAQLISMQREGSEFAPLLRFWAKLRKNPDPDVINQLYEFSKNKDIPINEFGDLVCEKGVKDRGGRLVDCHSGKFDNSIGMTVKENRELCDPNPSRTCSAGLHVGAPSYVRKYYGSDWMSCNVIIQVTVNPENVVSVPTDYQGAKMRVCEYVVIGYSEKDSKNKPVVKLSDICTINAAASAAYTKTQKKVTKRTKKAVDKARANGTAVDLSKRFYVSIGKGKDSYMIIYSTKRKSDATRKYNLINLKKKGEKKRLTDNLTGERISMDVKK